MNNRDDRQNSVAAAATRSHDGAMTRSEERLRISSETVAVGRVRLRKYLVTEQQTFTVAVTREEIALDHEDIPEHDQVPDGTGPLGPDDVELVRYEERVVITKEVVPVERIHLMRRVVTADHSVVGEVRRELIDVDQVDVHQVEAGDAAAPGRR